MIKENFKNKSITENRNLSENKMFQKNINNTFPKGKKTTNIKNKKDFKNQLFQKENNIKA